MELLGYAVQTEETHEHPFRTMFVLKQCIKFQNFLSSYLLGISLFYIPGSFHSFACLLALLLISCFDFNLTSFFKYII